MEIYRSRAVLMTVAAAVFWSIGGLVIKILPQDAFTILFYRSLYAAIFFIFVFRKKILLVNKISIVSCLFYAALLILFVSATKLTTAANAIFLQYSAPAFVLLLEPYFNKARLTKINVATVILCFIGMCLFFVEQFTSPDNWLGIWLALLSGVVLAGLLISQKINNSDYLPGTVFWGNILVCLLTLSHTAQVASPSLVEHGYLLLLGFGQLGLGYALFVYGQKYLPALESSLIGMLEPILNPVWVYIGYGENPGSWAIIGGIIIIGALIFRLYWMEKENKSILSG